jgi:anti-anti-sigma regulatory factor
MNDTPAQRASRIRDLHIEGKPGVKVLQPVDRNLLDESTITQFGRDVQADIEAEPNSRQYCLDLTETDHVSNAALGELVVINNRLRDKRMGPAEGYQGLSVIATPQVREILTITKLNKLLPTYRDIESYLATTDA